MGKQHNKIEKRSRRAAYLKRKREADKSKAASKPAAEKKPEAEPAAAESAE